MKQLTLTTVSLICAAAAPLCADQMESHAISQADANKSNSYGSGNKQDTESEKQFHQRWRNNQITPRAKPRDGGLFVTADFIWWKAHEDGLEYAYNGAPVGSAVVTPLSVASGKMLDTHFKYDPGFKVGIGYIFNHDGWDVNFEYTWLRSNHHHDTDDSDDCCAVGPTPAWTNYWLPSNEGPASLYVDDPSSRWRLGFNVLDCELGRNFYISKYLTLRPHFGLKFGWLHQKFHVHYDDVLFSPDTTLFPVGSSVEISNRQHEFGVGLRAGFNTAWYFTKMFAIYGDFALTGMWNRFKERRHDTVTTAAGVSYNTVNMSDRQYEVTAIMELGLGLRFEMGFCQDDYLLQVDVGWEDQIWFDQNQFITVEHLSPKNLNLEGLTVKAGFYF